jgi:hypothetical protein
MDVCDQSMDVHLISTYEIPWFGGDTGYSP